eukprot:2648320-Amphidinium_carterae.1
MASDDQRRQHIQPDRDVNTVPLLKWSSLETDAQQCARCQAQELLGILLQRCSAATILAK